MSDSDFHGELAQQLRGDSKVIQHPCRGGGSGSDWKETGPAVLTGGGTVR
jgi:hypothetical protein